MGGTGNGSLLSSPGPVRAVEHIRRMPGGSQPHLLRCREATGAEAYYVVKFQGNPQHRRVLANEWIAAWLASRLELPTPQTAIIDVSADLIDGNEELAFHLSRGQARLRPGLHFGSRYPGDPANVVVYDFLPEKLLAEVDNLQDFLGMLVFDKWACNTDHRQVIFTRPPNQSRFQALMIDHGFCFNGGEWNFPDSPLRGLYALARVYESVSGLASFEPWLQRIENRPTEDELEDVVSKMPPEWYDFDQDALYKLLGRLWRRCQEVRRLIAESRDTYRRPFPNWT
jgi:hypothetical protein